MARRWLRHPLLAALLLATFCVRALIPAGYMPGDGGLILCPAYTPVATSHAHHGMHHGVHDEGSHDGGAPMHDASALCPFAAAAASLAAAPPSPGLIAVARTAPRPVLPRPTPVPRDTVAPTRLPRGPPIPA